jgi:hypothetical protein
MHREEIPLEREEERAAEAVAEDLERRKVYQVIPDAESEKEGYIRVIDESGEDYLYPESYFVRVQLPEEAEKMIVAAR